MATITETENQRALPMSFEASVDVLQPRYRIGAFMATLTGLGYVLMMIPALALWCVTTTAIPLVAITGGALLLFVTVPLTAGLANVHRRMAARVLDRPIQSAYRPTKGMSSWERLKTWARDPARWRDYGWLLVDCSLGFVLASLPAILLLAVVWWLVFPFVFWVTPDGIFDMQLGFMTIDTQGETFATWGAAVVFGLIWWFASGPIIRGKANIDRLVLSPGRREALQRRVAEVTESRTQTVDHAAAELRRIERDLHDGAQARLVALGMSLGLADELMDRDPEAARKMLAEARQTSSAALGDIRDVVRGIHPPVLADRGLVGAVQALAMDMPIPVEVSAQVDGRPPAPVVSAVYFAIAECLANTGKHAQARNAWVTMSYVAGRAKLPGVLVIEVGDDGVGGASASAGTGMLGVMRRLSAFDGTMSVSSPIGGPTIVALEVPCELSSQRTTPSSGTDSSGS